MLSGKSRTRRADIRRCRPDATWLSREKWTAEGVGQSLLIAVAFFICAAVILSWRQEVIPYRPGQWIPHNIMARVAFNYFDSGKLENARLQKRQEEPRIYLANPAGDPWDVVRKDLLDLPDRVANSTPDLPEDLKGVLDSGAVSQLREQFAGARRKQYVQNIEAFIDTLRKQTVTADGKNWSLIILPADQWRDEVRPHHRTIRMGSDGLIDASFTYAAHDDALRPILAKAADKYFSLSIQPNIVDLTLKKLDPTHVMDIAATQNAENEAASMVPDSVGQVFVAKDQPFIISTQRKAVFDQLDWLKLRSENSQYLHQLRPTELVRSRLGTAFLAFIMTVVLSLYIASYQPKIIRNHARALGIAGLLLSTLLLAQLTGLGNGPLYLLGVAADYCSWR